MDTRRGTSLSALCTALVLVGLAGSRCLAAEDAGTRAVVDWNVIALRTVQTGEPLLAASRNLAMSQVAVFDALNSIAPRYKPYFLKTSAHSDASDVAAVASAAYETLITLYPAEKEALDRDLGVTLAQVPAGPRKDAAIAVGRQAAQAVLRARANDHLHDPVEYVVGSDPGAWQPTPGDGIAPWLDPRGPDLVPAIGPGWGRVTPFVLNSGAQFRPGPPPALSSEAYAKDFAEIVDLGSAKSATRTAEQTETALLWWSTGTVLWNQPAQQLAIAQGFDALRAAHAFALLNVMIVDAAISCWDAKYAYNQWRPITGIRHAHVDGNPATVADYEWTPLMWTPPFPDYPSGHSVVGGAAARALAHSFGATPGPFTLTGAGGRMHRYQGFDEVVQEVIDARVWAGAHWRSSDTLGVEMGNRIAEYVLSQRGQ